MVENFFMKNYRKLERSREILAEREERVNNIVYDVLEALEYQVKRMGIYKVEVIGETVYVYYSCSSRGVRDNNSMFFPLALFTGENPKLEAQEYRKRELELQAKGERARKEREIARLQQELADLTKTENNVTM